MLDSLKASKLLKGYRGSAPCDCSAMADLIVQVADYAVQNKDTLKELDLNPVFLYEEGQGVAIADALIIHEIRKGR